MKRWITSSHNVHNLHFWPVFSQTQTWCILTSQFSFQTPVFLSLCGAFHNSRPIKDCNWTVHNVERDACMYRRIWYYSSSENEKFPFLNLSHIPRTQGVNTIRSMKHFKMVAERWSAVWEVYQGMNRFPLRKKKKYYCVESLDMIVSLLLNILNIETPFELVVI